MTLRGAGTKKAKGGPSAEGRGSLDKSRRPNSPAPFEQIRPAETKYHRARSSARSQEGQKNSSLAGRERNAPLGFSLRMEG